MTLEEIRERGMTHARAMVQARAAFIAEERKLCEALKETPSRALPAGYAVALFTFAEFEADVLSADSAAERMSKQLGLHDLCITAAAQALPAAQQMELMLQGRFEATLKGN